MHIGILQNIGTKRGSRYITTLLTFDFPFFPEWPNQN
jgi:hypothetical protein